MLNFLHRSRSQIHGTYVWIRTLLGSELYAWYLLTWFGRSANLNKEIPEICPIEEVCEIYVFYQHYRILVYFSLWRGQWGVLMVGDSSCWEMGINEHTFPQDCEKQFHSLTLKLGGEVQEPWLQKRSVMCGLLILKPLSTWQTRGNGFLILFQFQLATGQWQL